MEPPISSADNRQKILREQRQSHRQGMEGTPRGKGRTRPDEWGVKRVR